ncbi:MAG: TatD family hydrolase [Deltaproteobacteria bacterium]|nr:TatD family hydrolase [Deltaproteobacteria bacterium]
MPILVDTHCHLDQVEDVNSYITKARYYGVNYLLAIGASSGVESNIKTFEIASSFKEVYCSIGFHPSDAEKICKFDVFESILSSNKVIAIGETGLDTKYSIDLKKQKELFMDQITLAQELKKPLIVHCRGLYKDTAEMIKNYSLPAVIFHCFSGDSEDLKFALSVENSFVSVSGIVTFKKNESVRYAVKKVPLDKLLLETDAPFLAPEPYRGKKCESWMIVETAKVVANLLGVEFEKICEQTTSNFFKIFNIQCGS